MQKKFKGILINYKIYKENDLFIKFLSETDEILSGIVYGGLSRKKKLIYQVGYYLEFNVSYKSNRPLSINAELVKPFISLIIDNKYKLNCLISIAALINLSIVEGQKIKNIYNITDKFLLKMFNNKKWFKHYCIFLFELLKMIGYEINFAQNKNNIYFDLETLEFKKKPDNNTVIFPFNLFNIENNQIDKKSVAIFFNIFEIVFNRHHLSNFNLHLPNQYQLFKKLIIDSISK